MGHAKIILESTVLSVHKVTSGIYHGAGDEEGEQLPLQSWESNDTGFKTIVVNNAFIPNSRFNPKSFSKVSATEISSSSNRNLF